MKKLDFILYSAMILVCIVGFSQEFSTKNFDGMCWVVSCFIWVGISFINSHDNFKKK